MAKKELCAIAGTYAGANAADADWEAAEKSLRDFATKYPGCVDERLHVATPIARQRWPAAGQLADEIAVLESAKRAARSDEAMAAMLEKPNAWEFLLLAFFIAAIGVSIKCARAASDYLPARHSR